MSKYLVKKDLSRVKWNEVQNLLKIAGLAHPPAELIEKAFKNSYSVVFIYNEDKIIGVGRGISDGAYQAAIYDIAVHPEYQGNGLGKTIIDEIYKDLKEFNIILYSRPASENFYRKLGFEKMLTGMAIFKDRNGMKEKGFTE